MSTAKFDNWEPSAGGTTVDVAGGLAKGFVSFDQTVPSITDSMNVSSVTDSSAGNFEMNHTNAYAAGGYNFSGGAGLSGDSYFLHTSSRAGVAVLTFAGRTKNDAGTATDCDISCVCIHGGLA